MRSPFSWCLAVLVPAAGLASCTAWELKEEGDPAQVDSGAPAAVDDSGDPLGADEDGDGTPAGRDCDDRDPERYPGAPERCNGEDDDCDGETDEGVLEVFHADDDGDGFGDPDREVRACTAPSGTVADATDCDDADGGVHPDAEEVCNDRDDDCDGLTDEDGDATLYEDRDGDGWGNEAVTATGCPEPGWVEQGGDCDDEDGSASPGNLVDLCDGVDSDCDGAVDEDSKDGWSLLSVNTGDGNVYDVDPASGALTSLSSVSTDIRINSMDVNENRTAVVHIARDQQIAYFDSCTGSYTVIGTHAAGAIGGLAFGPGGRLFGIGGASDALWEFDLATGAATRIGSLGIDIGSSGLAYDCTTQTLYGADTFEDRIFEIDVATGAARNERATAVPFEAVGLEFDRVTGQLYASTGAALYTIDPTTGASSLVGDFDAYFMDDLAWHPTCP